MSGFVYLITDGEYHKIGIAQDVVARMIDLQTANPRELRIVYVIEPENAERLEEELHRHFGHRHIRGEWFKLDDGDIEWIKRGPWAFVPMPGVLVSTVRMLRRVGISVDVNRRVDALEILGANLGMLASTGVQVQHSCVGGVLTLKIKDVEERRDAEGMYFVPAGETTV